MSRGQSKRTIELLEVSHEILEAIQPATVRAVCYKLFVQGHIASMAKNETNKISRLLTIGRESGEIPWDWVVDETRSAEFGGGWDRPEDFARSMVRGYCKDYWSQQPCKIEVWSEKGTVRGTLAPVLNSYGVTFRVMHGYGSATQVHDIADETQYDDVPRRILYVGDYDPSGMQMSEIDLPKRLEKYGASVDLTRVALTVDDANSGLPHFASDDKRSDPRHAWYVRHYGPRCWELDALDPNVLRDRVEQFILDEIDVETWNRCIAIEKAERQSLDEVLRNWKEARA